MGLSVDPGFALGELLGKRTRHQLALLCLESITNIRDSEEPARSPEVILAGMLGVSVRTVFRWVDAGGIQASDLNAQRLAEFAYSHFPEEVSMLLMMEAKDHLRVVEAWLTSMVDR